MRAAAALALVVLASPAARLARAEPPPPAPSQPAAPSPSQPAAPSPSPPAPSSPPSTDETAKARAKVLLDAGNTLQDQGDHLGALELFRQAYAAFPSPLLHINIGTALWNLGRFVEASRAFEQVLAAPEVPEERKAEVRAHLAELDKVIARLEITVDPAGARLVVDGVEASAATPPVTVRVDPGPHVIVADAPGHTAATATVTVAAGERRPLVVRLEVIEAPPARVVERLVTAPLRATAGRLGGAAQVAVDPLGPGAAVTVAATWGLLDWCDVGIGGIVGGTPGGFVSATAFVWGTRLRPAITVALPTFFDGGAHPGLRGAVGLEWRATDHVGLALELGVEHYLSVPADHVDTLFVPSIGVSARR